MKTYNPNFFCIFVKSKILYLYSHYKKMQKEMSILIKISFKDLKRFVNLILEY